MKEMRECNYIEILDEQFPNWTDINGLYFEKYRETKKARLNRDGTFEKDSKGFLVYDPVNDTTPPIMIKFKGVCRYCENCCEEMFWQTIEVAYKLNISTAAEHYNDPVAKCIKESSDKINNKETDIERSVYKLKLCPICGAPLRKEEGGGKFGKIGAYKTGGFFNRFTAWSFWYGNNSPKEFYSKDGYYKDLQECFLKMKDLREEVYSSEDEKASEVLYKNIIDECTDTTSVSFTRNNSIQNDLSDLNKLQEYILTAIELEECKLSLESRIKQITSRIPASDRNAKLAKNQQLQSRSIEIEEKRNNFEKEKEEIEVNTFGLSMLELPNEPIQPVRPEEPKYEIPGLFNKKKVQKANEILKTKYDEAVQEYNEKKQTYDKQFEEYTETCSKITDQNNETERRIVQTREVLLNQKREELEQEIEIIKEACDSEDSFAPAIAESMLFTEELKEAKEAYITLLNEKEKYYAYNIIFPKYRNLEALSSIYEYLMTGRCNSLQGSNGAYNLYETELRQNIIIAKLDYVINQLEQIKNSQFMLYESVKKVQDSLKSIAGKMEAACSALYSMQDNTGRILTNSEVIANNTSVMAYYTKKNAYYSRITSIINAAEYFGI